VPEYLVVGCSYGECCPQAHLVCARVAAENAEAAKQRLARYIRDVEGNEPGEVASFGCFEEVPPLEAVQQRSWEEHEGPEDE
jgi:hypothetical protein